ncbi:MAG: hypothetical protein RTU30_05790 [Candidatus Thorarchaeota archaeon]
MSNYDIRNITCPHCSITHTYSLDEIRHKGYVDCQNCGGAIRVELAEDEYPEEVTLPDGGWPASQQPAPRPVRQQGGCCGSSRNTVLLIGVLVFLFTPFIIGLTVGLFLICMGCMMKPQRAQQRMPGSDDPGLGFQ